MTETMKEYIERKRKDSEPDKIIDRVADESFGGIGGLNGFVGKSGQVLVFGPENEVEWRTPQ